MRIDRSALVADLVKFATSGSGLVIGPPGVGKTHALARMVRELEHRNIPALLVLVEDLGDGSEETMRSVLGYEQGTFRDALEALFEASPSSGVVVFDGFDAARSPEGREQVLRVIRTAQNAVPAGWSVVVSVRTYDALKSPTLLGIFPKDDDSDSPFVDPQISVRHFLVPELNEEELSTALEGSEKLQDVLAEASASLLRLSKNPFNLWLVERIAEQLEEGSVTPLASQTELLLLFWKHRITNSAHRHTATLLLQQVLRRMVEIRRLSVPKSDVWADGDETLWDYLLSLDILRETGVAEQRIGFSHHILFDYAVSILLMEDTAEALRTFLIEDPSRPLFLRPSLLHYFARLWSQEQGEFWSIFWELLPSKEVPIRLVVRLIPPYIAVTEGQVVSDFQPLLHRVNSGAPGASEAVLRILQAARFAEQTDPGLLLSLAEHLSRAPAEVFAWELGQLIGRLSSSKAVAGAERLGATAFTLFNWAWRHRTESNWLDALASNILLAPVLHHAESASIESTVERILPLLNTPRFPIDYFTVLCNEIESLAKTDPELAASVYESVFHHVEKSEEETPIGGVILPMRSTRRQDFGICYYILAQEFPHFLNAAPLLATKTAFRLLDYLVREQVNGFLEPEHDLHELTTELEIDGTEIRILEDFGDHWFSSREEVKEIAGTAERWLSEHRGDPSPATVTRFFTQEIRAASVWGRLFLVGAAQPRRYAEVLHPLVPQFSTIHPIIGQIAHFVEESYRYLSPEQRADIERALLERRTGDKSDRSVSVLQGVAVELIQLPEARDWVNNQNFTRKETAAEARIRVAQSLGDEERLEEHTSLDVEDLHEGLREDLERLQSEWERNEPTGEEIAQNVDFLGHALEALSNRPATDLYDPSWTSLAKLAVAVAESAPSPDSDLYEVARDILLRAVEDFAPSEEEKDYTSLSWSPSPRSEAAKGLPHLLALRDDPLIKQALRALVSSPDPSERAVTLLHLAHARNSAGGWLLEMLQDRAEREQNATVITAIFYCLRYLAEGRDGIARLILETRIVRVDESRELARVFGQWLSYFYFRLGEDWAEALLRRGLTEERFEFLDIVTSDALGILHAGSADIQEEGIRNRVINWTIELVGYLSRLLREWQQVQAEPERIRSAHSVIDSLVAKVYFNAKQDPDTDSSPSAENLAEYFKVVTPLLDEFAGFWRDYGAAVPRTAHYFVQLMNVMLPFDPERALALSWQVVSAAASQGYHLDGLATREVVALAEGVLTDHPRLIRGGQSLDDLLNLLDLFSNVGWPETNQLVWRLDEAFR